MEVIALSISKKNKIAGAVYGFAIGDAMGATTEFMKPLEIKNSFCCLKDIVGGGWLNLSPGEVTDDTQMTICVMDAIMKYPDNREMFKKECAKNFVVWLNSKPKDIGNACLKSIIRLERNENIPVNNFDLGNGSLMRAMPCALLNKPDFNIMQGRLTHNNNLCSSIIQDYTRLLQSYFNNIYNINISKEIKCLLEPSGYIKNTFNNSVYWSKKYSFEEAIVGAVNDGGDADTIAAITGSLAGAKFGYDNIPKRWINQLNYDIKIYLENFINFCFSYLQI